VKPRPISLVVGRRWAAWDDVSAIAVHAQVQLVEIFQTADKALWKCRRVEQCELIEVVGQDSHSTSAPGDAAYAHVRRQPSAQTDASV
jgi:hypothetical protein